MSTCAQVGPMETLRGAQFTISDGTTLRTEIISDEDSHLCLYVLLQDMLKVNDLVIGFEMEWGFKGRSHSRSGSDSANLTENSQLERSESVRKIEHRVALLTLCTRLGCVLIKLSPNTISASLMRFLAIKDIIFVGVHIKEDVQKLKEVYGLVIRNVVELSDLAAQIYDNPRFVFYNPRDLATKIISVKFDTKPYAVLWSNWFDHNLSAEQVECAAIDAYCCYRIGKKLMESGSASFKRLFN